MLTFETYFLQQNSVYFLQVRMTYSQIISSFVTFTCLFSYFSRCFVSKYQSLFKGTYICYVICVTGESDVTPRNASIAVSGANQTLKSEDYSPYFHVLWHCKNAQEALHAISNLVSFLHLTYLTCSKVSA